MSADVRMEIAGVRMDVPTGQPVVVLRELDGPRRLREQAAESPGGAEAQVREFRDFLDHVDPDDFQS